MTLETAQAWAVIIATMSSGVAAIVAAVNSHRVRSDLRPPSSEKTAGALLEQTATMSGTAALSLEGQVMPALDEAKRTAAATSQKVEEIHSQVTNGNH